MSALDTIIIDGVINATEIDKARSELSALRAALAEARRPKTCAGCKFITSWKHDGMLSCNNRLIAITTIRYPEEQSCIHWEPAEPAPGSGGGEGG